MVLDKRVDNEEGVKTCVTKVERIRDSSSREGCLPPGLINAVVDLGMEIHEEAGR